MQITTGEHPAIAATKADLVYDASDSLGGEFSPICFFSVDADYHPADRSVGEFYDSWHVSVTLIGCQLGTLVLGKDDALKALDGNVAFIERVAAEYETERRNASGVAA